MNYKGIAKQLIVSGTDTGIGKTVLSAALLLALDGCYWKPIQAGTDEETDSQTVARLTGLPATRILPEAYRLARPLSPDQSARGEGVTIDGSTLDPPATYRTLVIEGAGGLMVPLNDELLQIDLFARWSAPVVLAVRSGLGTLNHTLLSLEAMRSRRMTVAGIVMIGMEHRLNRESIERWSDVPVIGMVPPLDRLDREALIDVGRRHILPLDQWWSPS
jgi:dethiobiotin synthetase